MGAYLRLLLRRCYPAPVEAVIPAPVEAAVIGVDPALIHEGVFSREVAGISSLQNTGDHAWKSHSTLAASITIRMMPRTTIGREVQSAKNRIRFNQGERCRGTYSQLLLTLLHDVAELWLMLEEQQGFLLDDVLCLTKETLKKWQKVLVPRLMHPPL